MRSGGAAAAAAAVAIVLQVLVAVSSAVSVPGDSRSSRGHQEIDDADAEATGFGGAGIVQAHSKYFQYAHVPHKDHYEVGHRRGNDHHFIERHEKAHPHEGEFKTKVRWGDKHGGYGEHYWDYNHAGHDDAHDEGTEQVADYKEYDDVNQKAPRPKRHPEQLSPAETRVGEIAAPAPREPRLVFDIATGRIVDQNTGTAYLLQPIN